jgi:hypothetical protein
MPPDKQYNVRAELRTIGKKASKKAGGNVMRPQLALTRAPAMQLDSSDEEEERLLALGAEGKYYVVTMAKYIDVARISSVFGAYLWRIHEYLVLGGIYGVATCI